MTDSFNDFLFWKTDIPDLENNDCLQKNSHGCWSMHHNGSRGPHEQVSLSSGGGDVTGFSVQNIIESGSEILSHHQLNGNQVGNTQPCHISSQQELTEELDEYSNDAFLTNNSDAFNGSLNHDVVKNEGVPDLNVVNMSETRFNFSAETALCRNGMSMASNPRIDPIPSSDLRTGIRTEACSIKSLRPCSLDIKCKNSTRLPFSGNNNNMGNKQATPGVPGTPKMQPKANTKSPSKLMSKLRKKQTLETKPLPLLQTLVTESLPSPAESNTKSVYVDAKSRLNSPLTEEVFDTFKENGTELNDDLSEITFDLRNDDPSISITTQDNCSSSSSSRTLEQKDIPKSNGSPSSVSQRRSSSFGSNSSNSLTSPSTPNTTFVVTQHKKVVIPPIQSVTPKSPAKKSSPAATAPSSRHSSVSSAYDVTGIQDGNVLRKVASLTFENAKSTNHSDTSKITRPKFVPTKLDFTLSEKFDGKILIKQNFRKFLINLNN